MVVNVSNLQADSYQSTKPSEVEQLRAQVTALEQLLEVYERETVERSKKLEQTLADLHNHTQRLTHTELTLSTLRSMLNSMGDAVVVVDQEGYFLFLNPSAASLLGIGANCSSLSSWAQIWNIYLPNQTTQYPLETFPLAKAMQGETLDATEIFVRSPQARDGLWFSVTARSLVDQAGALQGGVAVFHNITQIKQTELALRHSETRSREQAQQLQQTLTDLHQVQAQLIQTEKMSSLGQLVAGVAHEINNPVNFIYGNVNHVRNNTEDLLNLVELYATHYPNPHPDILEATEAMDLDFVIADFPGLLKSMKLGAERIKGIVSSLRTFSHMDEAEMKAVDLHEGLESTLLILQNRLKAQPNRLAINVNLKYGDLPPVECYPGQLNQVYMNILSNAIDALEEGGKGESPQNVNPTITITTQITSNHQVEIQVQDNGPGLPEKVRARLFDPFFTTKPIGKGTGMGLSISYQIVTEKHGGRLLCESQVGKGTTFTITIPLKQQLTKG
ncbi:MAG: ATP-binding protein [Leptolyngbyaceae cyanobacterium MO_188.B28]|nr:ATP-binding protein [Leptolyngbyaceae cyanobacterium MO_188.B28]